MLVKFFKRGVGNTKSGESVKEYLLDNRVENGTAKVIRGSEMLTTGIINSIQRYAKTYTSGCLSFDEGENLTEEEKQKKIDDFENTLLPSLDFDQYSSYWVEHTDKGRLELNFVIANVELRSKKAMTVYNHSSDFGLVNLWKNLTNFQHGFNNPSDPANARNFAPSHVHENKSKKKQDYAEHIGLEIAQRIEQNQIRNRNDVIDVIGKLGYQVTDVKKQFIKIANPDPTLYRGKKRRDIKLTGDYFEQDFIPSHTTNNYRQQESQKFNDDILLNFDKYCDEYESRLEHRSKFLLKHYQREDTEKSLLLHSTPEKPKNYNQLLADYQQRQALQKAPQQPLPQAQQAQADESIQKPLSKPRFKF